MSRDPREVVEDLPTGSSAVSPPPLSDAKAELLARWHRGVTPLLFDEVRIEPIARDAPAPATVVQRRLWQARDVASDLSLGAIGFFGNVAAPLDVVAVEAAIERLAQRHEALRTTFDEDADGSCVQVIHPTAKLSFDVVDLRDGGGDAEQVAWDHAHAMMHQPMDLRRGPLVHAVIYRLPAAMHAVSIVAHHAISDGWSLAIAMRDLDLCYSALVKGQSPAWPPLPFQHRDYAAWEKRWLASGLASTHVDFWRAQLQGRSAGLLPFDPEATGVEGAGGHVAFEFDESTGRAARALASELGVSLSAPFLAAYAVMLADRAGSPEITVIVATSKRHRPEIRWVIGSIAAAITVPITVNEDASFAALVRATHATTMSCLAHQDLDLALYVSEFDSGWDRRRSGISTASFNLQNLPPLELGGGTITPLQLPTTYATGEFALHLFEGDFGVHGRVQYASDAFVEGTVAAMVRQVEDVLTRGVAHPEIPIHALGRD